MLRSKIFQQVRTHFPEYLPHLRLAYQRGKRLLVRGRPGEYVLAERGVEQGDPWGPFLFALGLVLALADVAPWLAADSGNKAAVVALLDDLSIVAPLNTLSRLLPVLRPALQAIGLDLNLAKTHVLCRGVAPAALVAGLTAGGA